ncbi:hypothetical protein SAMN02982919_03227 [Giesbergeria anulus]|uniref:Uncharacterized protein n=1 Tax=Giesbergeria anulus TaxID=180197 RepID=A0A1H9SVP4_9BURK|nr:hypothetical protein SAMN02982919_03227 [Giesbergeria anulus]
MSMLTKRPGLLPNAMEARLISDTLKVVCNEAVVVLLQRSIQHHVVLRHLGLRSPPRPRCPASYWVPNQLISEPLEIWLASNIAQLLMRIKLAAREEH